MSFTDHLLGKYRRDFETATQHPFLKAAGDGSIKKVALEKWLRQDYLYAYVGYIRYASLLLSRLPYPTVPPSISQTSSLREQTFHKALSVILFSLSNVHRETGFFTSTAAKFGLDLFPQGRLPNANGGEIDDSTGLLGQYEGVTRAYVDYLHAIAATGTVEEGIVVLWAMEKAYLEAWTYAKSQRPDAAPANPTRTQEALVDLIDNWTCEEFVGFVKDCEDLINGLVSKNDELAEKCEQAFKRIMWLEQRFWPSL